ncbi:MAG: MoxR family ATPase [Lentisphaerae bacterium]|nr:MoxR family ATPase [Lentisphaerota bacterium]
MESHDLKQLQQEVKNVSAPLQLLRQEIGRIVSGQQELVDRLLLALISDGHVLLEGVPGLAKTLTVKTLAKALDGSFSRLQFTPDLLPADVIGTRIYNAATGNFSTKVGPVAANIVLADEINRAPAKVQSALLEAMQEKQLTIGGDKFALPSPFLVMATQNPIEQEGTYPLPEAQLDRFMFKLHVSYPARAEEFDIIDRMAHPVPPPEAVSVASLADIIAARQLVDRIYLDEKIVEYILDIVIATRPGEKKQLSARQQDADLSALASLIDYGASPRASIALAIGSRALALLRGRAYVLPQDVKDLAPDVLRHRLVLSYEAEAENINADDLISRILAALRTP